jgi:hypothetical protein
MSARCIPHCLVHAYEPQRVEPIGEPAESAKRGRKSNISPDGKWKSFPRTPILTQCVSGGDFFGRLKMGGSAGKIVRQSLGTTVFTTAKLRMGDFLKAERKRVPGFEVAQTFPPVSWAKASTRHCS